VRDRTVAKHKNEFLVLDVAESPVVFGEEAKPLESGQTVLPREFIRAWESLLVTLLGFIEFLKNPGDNGA
jgi:hypothetical protein